MVAMIPMLSPRRVGGCLAGAMSFGTVALAEGVDVTLPMDTGGIVVMFDR